MANKDHGRRASPFAVHHGDKADGADAARRRDLAPELPADVHPGAQRGDDLPEAARRVPGAKLVSALEALTEAATIGRNASFAVLGELRRGRKYREKNPPRRELAGNSIGRCEQCGAWFGSFDELVHHQFDRHVEIFAPVGELAFEAEPCLCSSCSPGAFGEWCRDLPEPMALPKAKRGKPKGS